jgi:nitrogen fixation protein NifX
MIRIAFASKDGISVNEHFGWCETFYIYEIDQSSSRLVSQQDASQKLEDEVEKLIYKIESLDNSDIVYVAQIGPKAANMVKKAGIYPMSSSNQEQKIDDVIASIQKMLGADTPLWLQRIVMKKRV